MNLYRVSVEARSDLEDIWIYIAQDNPDAADKVVRTIVSKLPKLAATPYLGRERKELATGLRSFPVGRYVIFYRVTEHHVDIVRILHGARDFPPLL